MNESIKKMYEQEPKTWYAKIIVALIVAALLAWSLSTVQSTGSNGSGLSVAGMIISGIFHPDTGLLFDLSTSGVAYLLLETMCIAFLGTIVGAVLSIPLSFLAAANLMPVIAANRIGTETVEPCEENGGQTSALNFYGSSFIADETGELISEASRDQEEILYSEFDLAELAQKRLEWGLFRDRRPEMYGIIVGKK